MDMKTAPEILQHQEITDALTWPLFKGGLPPSTVSEKTKVPIISVCASRVRWEKHKNAPPMPEQQKPKPDTIPPPTVSQNELTDTLHLKVVPPTETEGDDFFAEGKKELTTPTTKDEETTSLRAAMIKTIGRATYYEISSEFSPQEQKLIQLLYGSLTGTLSLDEQLKI